MATAALSRFCTSPVEPSSRTSRPSATSIVAHAAFLRVAGDFNWWAPRPLKWLHDRIGFSETPPDPRTTPMQQPPEPDTVRFLNTALIAPTVRIRRPIGYLVLEDNSRFEIDRDCVVGRIPHESNAVVRGGLRPVRIGGLTGGMSRVHIEIRHVNGQVFVVDVGSRNGTFLREPATCDWIRLAPWQPAVLRPGAALRVGGRTLRFENAYQSTAPAGQSGHPMRRSDPPTLRIDTRPAMSTPGPRRPAIRRYPVGAGVDVHRFASQDRHQRQPDFSLRAKV
jgi:hypothetical protein